MTRRLHVGISSRPAVGQKVCGDVSLVVEAAPRTLVCVADGLGHGEEANVAAARACAYVGDHAAEPLETLMRGLDRALAGTRGAAVSIVVLRPHDALVQFVGVGNVELRAHARTPIAPPAMPGIVGRGLRTVRVWEYALSTGDLVLLLTDGISSRFDLGAFSGLAPQAIAEGLIAKHHKTHDDACCVAVRVGAA